MQKAFDKIQHAFMIKITHKTRNKRELLNIKGIYEKSTANIIMVKKNRTKTTMPTVIHQE